MNTIVTYYLEIFGEFFTLSLYRVFLGAAIFFAPFGALAGVLWISESNLLVFTGSWASKLAAVAVCGYGLNISFAVFWALGEGHSEYMTIGEGAIP